MCILHTVQFRLLCMLNHVWLCMKLLQPLTVPRVKRMVKRWLDGMALLTQMESMISYKIYCMFYIYMYTAARA